MALMAVKHQHPIYTLPTVFSMLIKMLQPFQTTLIMRYPIRVRNHHTWLYHAHHEARLVEVVEVAVEDAVFRPHVGNQSEPWLHNCRIFAETSLIVIDAIKTRL